MTDPGKRLFELLPALYRLKDAHLAQAQQLLTATELAQLKQLQSRPAVRSPSQQAKLKQLVAKAGRGPLQSLLMIIAEQLAIVADNLDQLYDDQFIETCAPWVVPYIGDLVGYQALNARAPTQTSPRAAVARTLSFRSRKGSVLVLEQLTRDVTGWGARAVQFFQLLAATQYLNHLRPEDVSPDLRRWNVAQYIDSGFDTAPHTVDVRRIALQRGRYNIQNIGIFLWSLTAFPVDYSAAAPMGQNPHCLHFNSLGRDMPLFNRPSLLPTNSETPAQPQNVADRITRHVLCHDLRQYERAKQAHEPADTVYYGEGKSLALRVAKIAKSPDDFQVCNLEDQPDGTWSNLPKAGGKIAVDPELGRLALPPDMDASQIEVAYCYGFQAPIGGGPYPRSSNAATTTGPGVVRVPDNYPTIHEALNALAGNGTVQVTDGGIYHEAGGLNVQVSANGQIQLVAKNGTRPTLILGAECAISGSSGSSFALDGFAVSYAAPPNGGPLPRSLLHVPAANSNQLSQLSLTDCTLVPDWADPQHKGIAQPPPSLWVEAATTKLTIQRAVVGSLWVNTLGSTDVADSIIDATDPAGVAYIAVNDPAATALLPGGALTLNRGTVIGKVYAVLFSLVSDTLIWARLSNQDRSRAPTHWLAPFWTARKQEGCVRFSYVPAGSLTGRQFQCVVDSPQPLFYSLSYGDPGYGKLLDATDDKIRRGASDGGEMGVFHLIFASLREANLRVRLQEFVPVGMEYGIFYEN
jgi:hypothetical protein